MITMRSTATLNSPPPAIIFSREVVNCIFVKVMVICMPQSLFLHNLHVWHSTFVYLDHCWERERESETLTSNTWFRPPRILGNESTAGDVAAPPWKTGLLDTASQKSLLGGDAVFSLTSAGRGVSPLATVQARGGGRPSLLPSWVTTCYWRLPLSRPALCLCPATVTASYWQNSHSDRGCRARRGAQPHWE